MARDLIISCFARAGQSQLNAAGLKMMRPEDAFPINKLTNSVDVIAIEKGMAGHVRSPSGTYCNGGDVWGGFCFDQIAEKLRASGGGSILRGAILSKGLNPADYEGGRIALIAFSAGHTMARHILNSADAEKIDTVISLDGIAFSKVNGNLIDDQGWMNFARRSCGIDRMGANRNPYLGPMMVVADTRIAPASAAVAATYQSSERIFWRLTEDYMKKLASVPRSFVEQMAKAQQEIMSRVSRSLDVLPWPLTINCAGSKTFSRAAANPSRTGYLGNLWDLEWSGTQGADHCFIAYVAQRVIVESYLIPRWNSTDTSVAGLGSEALTNGSVTFQSPSYTARGGGVVNPGSLGPANFSVPTLALGALAAYGGYWLGKRWYAKKRK